MSRGLFKLLLLLLVLLLLLLLRLLLLLLLLLVVLLVLSLLLLLVLSLLLLLVIPVVLSEGLAALSLGCSPGCWIPVASGCRCPFFDCARLLCVRRRSGFQWSPRGVLPCFLAAPFAQFPSSYRHRATRLRIVGPK